MSQVQVLQQPQDRPPYCEWCDQPVSLHWPSPKTREHCLKMIKRANARSRVGIGMGARCRKCGHKRSEHRGTIMHKSDKDGKFHVHRRNTCWHATYHRNADPYCDDYDDCLCEHFL